ncbi:MAG: hypothetical protein OEY89_09790 [Gammaproteobacteria bacterium]|nr:hypothetical protein [Gammaproteobacteria bacterium]
MRNDLGLAKINPPVLGNIIKRKRLYQLIDENINAPVVWVSAPAGYGKTTLINSYIQSKHICSLWYKIDAGDKDIASFFYYMGLAIKNITATKYSAPLFTPEYQHGLPAFTRHYFREIYSHLPSDFMIVFDNYQDVGMDSELHRVMSNAAEELPRGCHLIFVSRENPTSDFSKLIANGDLFNLDSAQLEFNINESADVAHLLGVSKASGIEFINKAYSVTKGWVTGFKLLIEHQKNFNGSSLDIGSVNQNTMFNYFASEILSHIEPHIKTFLLKTSVLPVITVSLARKITGLRNTHKILDELVHKQLFTVIHDQVKQSYEYHPLFRAFLIAQMDNFLDESDIAELYGTAGTLLAEENEYESAIELLMTAERWGSILDIINRYSTVLLEQGRNKQLIQWLDRLPDESLNSDAYANYWYGMALLNYENIAARERFINAYNLFKKDRNSKGVYLSWSGIADSFSFSHNNFTGAKAWLNEFNKIKLTLSKLLMPEVRVRLLFSKAMLMYWADPVNPELRTLIGKIELLSKIAPDKTLKILCITQLLFFYGQQGNSIKINQLSSVFLKYVNDKSIPKHLLVFIHTLLIACDYLTADFKMTENEIDLAYKNFNDSGLSFFSGFMLPHAIYHAELKGDAKRVRMLIEKYKADVSEDSDMDYGHYHLHVAVCLIMEEDFTRALLHVQTATELTHQARASFQEHHCRMVQAYIYTETDQYDLAEEELEKSKLFFDAFSCYSGNAVILFIRSWIALNKGEHDRHIHHLTDALNLLQERDIRSCFFWPHKIIRKLCAIALDNNIRPEIVTKIIKIYQYTPDHEKIISDRWPYRIKIYTLSRFGIIKDDKPLRLSDKHQQFIKALIAFGGRDVHEETLSNALWPDADGDVAHQNFATTLHRVRKDIGSDIILLRQNHLSLNPDFCWIDIWALKRTLSEIEKSLIHSEDGLTELANRAISLYQGPFLGTDEHQFWMLPAREQLRNKYLKILDSLGDRFCQLGEYHQAIDCYQKGLEVDDLSENHYQGLLNCHFLLGNRAEGLALYQRCYVRLAEGLGITPSKTTEELRYKLENI